MPQLLGSDSVLTHVLPHICKPLAQTQDPCEQVIPAPHDVQLEPQCDESLLVSNAQAVEPPHALNPALHEVPQVPALHVARPFVGTAQLTQLAPQWVASSAVE